MFACANAHGAQNTTHRGTNKQFIMHLDEAKLNKISF